MATVEDVVTPPWHRRLDAVLHSWDRTPFAAGQCCKGRGADCRYFVVGVLDELYGVTAPRPKRLPLDTGWNNHPSRIAALREFTGRYPCRPLHPGREPYEPGDVLVVCRPGGPTEHAHHAAIVGVGEPVPLWHAGNGGVAFTSLVAYRVGHAFRLLNKESWSCPTVD
jgi:cell wall-associated NlpC family hydrolase